MKAAAPKSKNRKSKEARKALPYRGHEEVTIESFRRDPRFAAEYLNAILEEGDQEELLLALHYMARAFGGVPKLAESARLNATTLYRTLSPKGNPELKSLTALLKAMGMRLACGGCSAPAKVMRVCHGTHHVSCDHHRKILAGLLRDSLCIVLHSYARLQRAPCT